jgi:hypothetical protein
MNKKIVVLFLLCALAGASLWADAPLPPPWIYGQWQTVMKGSEGETETLLVVFLPDDILLNGASVAQMIQSGYISAYRQAVTKTSYTIRLEYASGFWWEESFPMPAMTSVYSDQSFADESFTRMTYTFLPFGSETPSGTPAEVPNDIE